MLRPTGRVSPKKGIERGAILLNEARGGRWEVLHHTRCTAGHALAEAARAWSHPSQTFGSGVSGSYDQRPAEEAELATRHDKTWQRALLQRRAAPSEWQRKFWHMAMHRIRSADGYELNDAHMCVNAAKK